MRVIEEHVRAAVHEFFSDRWIFLLAARVTAHGRREFRARLSGGVELRGRCGLDVSALCEQAVRDLLVARGAPPACVLVKDGLRDDEVTSLVSALHRTYLSGEGALISCLAGRLCLLQTDGGRRRVLLEARRAPRIPPDDGPWGGEQWDEAA